MSVCLLIITLINDQLSHDNFHKNRDRIYRVISQVKDRDGRLSTSATTTMPIANILKNEYAGVEKTVRLSKRLYGDGKTGEKLIPIRGLFADQSFFDVFGFSLIEGDEASALAEPFTIILSEKTAISLFNSINVSGEVIEIGDLGLYTVTGVVKDPPAKSHITFDAIASGSTMKILEKDNKLQPITENWKDPYSSYVYFLLEKDAHADNINKILSQIEDRYLNKEAEVKIHYLLQSLSSITPGPLMSNKLTFTLPVEVIIFMGILAIIVMLSACFNYTNLSLSRALTRAKEVGIRKVTGATKWQVIKQFLCESIFFSMLSMLIAVLIFKILLGAFNQMSIAREISLNIKELYSTYFWFIIFGLVVGIVAGLSPALFLSSFKPISVLKNISEIKIFSRITLRRSLVVLQFTISLLFIITAIVVHKQIFLYNNYDYGFNKENIINIKLQDVEAEQYINEIKRRADVIQVSASSHIPATGQNYGVRVRRKIEDEKSRFLFFYVDHNYLDNLGVKLIAGNNFPEDASKENEQFVLINRQAVDILNFDTPHEAIDETLILGDEQPISLQIIGVVENYHYDLLFIDIKGMALRYKPESFHYVNVKAKSDDMEATIAGLKKAWKKFDPYHEFDYEYFDQQLESSYGFIKDISGIISITAILAIIVSSLGLLGMAIYNAERRVKEVGVRKVMGADVKDIIFLLSRGFLFLLIISIVIASPLAFFANNLWLQQIANHITVGPGILLSGIGIILILGIITIGSQALRAAFTNPAVSLRDE
jgi:putative ABC transport system permease protein